MSEQDSCQAGGGQASLGSCPLHSAPVALAACVSSLSYFLLGPDIIIRGDREHASRCFFQNAPSVDGSRELSRGLQRSRDFQLPKLLRSFLGKRGRQRPRECLTVK